MTSEEGATTIHTGEAACKKVSQIGFSNRAALTEKFRSFLIPFLVLFKFAFLESSTTRTSVTFHVNLRGMIEVEKNTVFTDERTHWYVKPAFALFCNLDDIVLSVFPLPQNFSASFWNTVLLDPPSPV